MSAALLVLVAGAESQSVLTRRAVDGVVPRAEDIGIQAGRDPGRRAWRDASGVPIYQDGKLIVKFRPGVAAPQRLNAARQANATIGRAPVAAHFDILDLEPGSDVLAAAEAMAARSDVEYAQPMYVRYALDVPNDPFFSSQWNMSMLRMPRAWDINAGASPSVIVAVIDTGMAFQSVAYEFDTNPFEFDGLLFPSLGRITVPFAAAPDLATPGRFVDPWDFVWGDANPVDMDGHGTHVAGTIAQNTDNLEGVAGMAFNVRLMPLKVLSGEWDLIFGGIECCGGFDSDIAAAIVYAAERGAQVINLSLGGPGAFSPVLDDAIRFAVSLGVVVVMAGGNNFEDGNEPEMPAALGQAIDGAIAVGAVGRDRIRAYYSNTGSGIEVCAPGGNQRRHAFSGGVLQQMPDEAAAHTYLSGPASYGPPRFDVMALEFLQGTSMATPHVSGLAALLISQGITSPAAVEAAIKAFAEDLEPEGVDLNCGHGLIDPVTTLRGLGILR